MPRAKRIRNLLKAAKGTPEIQHISPNSEHSVGNYVEVTSAQPRTELGQKRIESEQPRARQPKIESGQPRTEHGEPSCEPYFPASKPAQPTPPSFESIKPTPESEPERVGPKKGRQSSHYWSVKATGKFNNVFLFSFIKCQFMFLKFIDEHGVSQNVKVKVKDALYMPSGLRVIVNYDDKYQPIGEASTLLAGVCGLLTSNHIMFVISFERWSAMPDTYKDNLWESSLKVK